MRQAYLYGVLLILYHQAKSLCTDFLNYLSDISITVGGTVPYEA